MMLGTFGRVQRGLAGQGETVGAGVSMLDPRTQALQAGLGIVEIGGIGPIKKHGLCVMG
jgi:hypothetical protein